MGNFTSQRTQFLQQINGEEKNPGGWCGDLSYQTNAMNASYLDLDLNNSLKTFLAQLGDMKHGLDIRWYCRFTKFIRCDISIIVMFLNNPYQLDTKKRNDVSEICLKYINKKDGINETYWWRVNVELGWWIGLGGLFCYICMCLKISIIRNLKK